MLGGSSVASMIWLTHMKTTVDISDRLLQQARGLAARRNTTLKAVIEASLRDALAKERVATRPATVRTRTFGGKGLQPGLSWDDWGAIRDLAYEGHGA